MRWALVLLLLAGCKGAEPYPEPTPAIPLIGSFLYYEDFEHGAEAWRLANEGPIGWYLLNAPVCGGQFSMHLGQKGRAPFADAPGTYTLTLGKPLDLGQAKRPHLTYDVRGVMEPPEAIVMQPEVRSPGGEWRAAGTPAIARYRYVFTRFADLSPWAGERIALRFRATVRRSAKPGEGLFLDMIQLIEPTGHEDASSQVQ